MVQWAYEGCVGYQEDKRVGATKCECGTFPARAQMSLKVALPSIFYHVLRHLFLDSTGRHACKSMIERVGAGQKEWTRRGLNPGPLQRAQAGALLQMEDDTTTPQAHDSFVCANI